METFLKFYYLDYSGYIGMWKWINSTDRKRASTTIYFTKNNRSKTPAKVFESNKVYVKFEL